MRRGREPKLIWLSGGEVGYDGSVPDAKIIGVNLGSDFCAEHEWGIRGLQDAFGIVNLIGIYGLNRRIVTQVPNAYPCNLEWVIFKSKCEDWGTAKNRKKPETLTNQGFCYDQWFGEKPADMARYMDLGSGRGLRAAWSENDFAVVSSEPAEIEALREIFTELKKCNAVITFSGALPAFDNPGLVIAIADRLPQSITDMWVESDRERHEIRQEVEASGIEELLKKAGKGYYALSPKRKDGALIFWLNPEAQKENNFGWFTLEDLKLWAENKVPHSDDKSRSLVMWSVFSPMSGGMMTYEVANPVTGEIKQGTLEFDSAAEAAMWSARFMTLMPDGPVELHLVNLEKGLKLVMRREEIPAYDAPEVDKS